MNIFTDVAFATIPVPVIWRLQMKTRTRIYLIAVFSLGYVYGLMQKPHPLCLKLMNETSAVAMGVVRAIYQIGFAAGPDSGLYVALVMLKETMLTVFQLSTCSVLGIVSDALF